MREGSPPHEYPTRSLRSEEALGLPSDHFRSYAMRRPEMLPLGHWVVMGSTGAPLRDEVTSYLLSKDKESLPLQKNSEAKEPEGGRTAHQETTMNLEPGS